MALLSFVSDITSFILFAGASSVFLSVLYNEDNEVNEDFGQ